MAHPPSVLSASQAIAPKVIQNQRCLNAGGVMGHFHLGLGL
jgi:hypothetical protein